jgi:hypothetical protein
MAIANTHYGVRHSRPKMPKSKPFDAEKGSKELENFIWDMEQYFSVAKVRVVDQVDITMMYLIGGVKLWWRKMIKEDLNAEHSKIKIWDRFKQKLKEKFLSSNTSWIAREELKKLRHEKSVQEYVKSFISLILNIKNMFEEDKLSNFMLGLQL